ncbi:MAG: hypothetical protein IJ744_11240 [Lachnospiraceae bacterium]|nr:hypothetical protein [Lachnospiraceae bacterium]
MNNEGAVNLQILKNIKDYEWARKHFFIRLRNAEQVKDCLRDCPWEKIEDLAVSYHVFLAETEGECASAVINWSLLNHYGISADELREEAIRNSQKILPLRMEPVQQMLERNRYLEGDRKEMAATIEEPGLWVVTNKRGIHGASAILYPGAIELAKLRIGGSFYVLPSSVHELILCPKTLECSPDELRNMIREINRSMLAPNERLSDELYEVDEENRIRRVKSVYCA